MEGDGKKEWLECRYQSSVVMLRVGKHVQRPKFIVVEKMKGGSGYLVTTRSRRGR